MLKQPNQRRAEIVLAYDLHHYFKRIYVHSYTKLEQKKNIIHAADKKYAKTWKDYAVGNVWYGRNDSRTLFSDIAVEYVI